jgi:hypothetical protein
VAYLQQNERPGDVVGLYYGGNQYVFSYYYHGPSNWAPLGDDEITTEHWTNWKDDRVRKMLSSFPYSGQRFWLIMSNHDKAGGASIADYVSRHYTVLVHQYFNQIEMILVSGSGSVPGKSAPHSH